MRIRDNDTPHGRYVGTSDLRLLANSRYGKASVCRDCHSRQCLVRPLELVRPATPKHWHILEQMTGLCSPCRRARISCGARGEDVYR